MSARRISISGRATVLTMGLRHVTIHQRLRVIGCGITRVCPLFEKFAEACSHGVSGEYRYGMGTTSIAMWMDISIKCSDFYSMSDNWSNTG